MDKMLQSCRPFFQNASICFFGVFFIGGSLAGTLGLFYQSFLYVASGDYCLAGILFFTSIMCFVGFGSILTS